ncbi:flagellar synthesis regulator FleN [Oceanococcus atlanticus]|uniref:Flagellar synthesis regulator FleN n=2 Tax=Oceanococcus atlanticus TaxID=1317117 RepID=A0A1Y1SGM6_9GAMM|nr:flagellar synthesis regulator FleN [Oceanococcus atlanticus]
MPVLDYHQASSMDRRHESSRPQVITVASGKGGVGKSSVSANLAFALQASGRRVLLLDADFGLANLDVLMGLQPRFHLGHVLEGRCDLADSIVTGPQGLLIVPAASGNTRLAEMCATEQAGLIHAFSDLDMPVDTLIVDSAAGIAGNVLTFAQAADHVLVVVCDEPASITDAYALIKVLSRDRQLSRFQVLANMSRDAGHGQQLFAKLLRVTDRFLNVNLEYLGHVPFDERLRQSIQRQQLVTQIWPGSPAALAFRDVAKTVSTWREVKRPRGHVEFFVDRMISPAVAVAS